MKIGRLWILLVVGLLVCEAAMAYACPGCNSALSGSVGRGFNMSILFMMLMPFALAASVAIGLVLVYRNRQKKASESVKSNSEEADLERSYSG